MTLQQESIETIPHLEPWKDVPNIQSIQFALTYIATSYPEYLAKFDREPFAYQAPSSGQVIQESSAPITVGEVIRLYSSAYEPYNLLNLAAHVLPASDVSTDIVRIFSVLSQLRVERIEIHTVDDLEQVISDVHEDTRLCLVEDSTILPIAMEDKYLIAQTPEGAANISTLVVDEQLHYENTIVGSEPVKPMFTILRFTPKDEIHYEARKGLKVSSLRVDQNDYDLQAAVKYITDIQADSYVFVAPVTPLDYPRIRESISELDRRSDFSPHEAMALLTLMRKSVIDDSFTGEFYPEALAELAESINAPLPVEGQIWNDEISVGIQQFVSACLNLRSTDNGFTVETIDAFSRALDLDLGEIHLMTTQEIIRIIDQQTQNEFLNLGVFDAANKRLSILLGAHIARNIYLTAFQHDLTD